MSIYDKVFYRTKLWRYELNLGGSVHITEIYSCENGDETELL